MNNTKYKQFEKYQVSPKIKRSENTITKNDSISGKNSSGIHEAFFQKINPNQKKLVYYHPTKQNKYSKNMKGTRNAQGKFCTSLNKDFYNKDHFIFKPYRLEESTSYEDCYNRTDVNQKSIALNSQSKMITN